MGPLTLFTDRLYVFPLWDSAHVFRIKGDYAEDLKLTVSFFGRSIVCDTAENMLAVAKQKGPLSHTKAELDLTVIVDRCSIEVFSDGGCIYMTDATSASVMDRNQKVFTVASNREYTISELEICSLKSIWAKNE